MVDKTVAVKFEASTTGYESGVKRMESATSKFAKSTDTSMRAASKGWDGIAKSARENSAEWTKAGATFTTFGVVSAAALGTAGKAAIDWESSWTGVLKTVDASEADLAALNRGLRDMALELPATAGEIAGVAEAAGQLGIATPNIESFTRTMIDLGETTNLSADEAATSLARFTNIMGTSQDEFSNLGSAVVELGNNYATTEREIVEMSLRLAGAGRQAGLTEGEVLGLATALSSVGIEAEAGGTAYSRVLIEMGVAVDTQNEKLETFASTAGMTAEQFSQAWGDDPGSAISAFVSGLGKMDSAGQSVQPVLEELGMTDIRVGDALRRSASAADLFTAAMATGNKAYAENNALTEEAALRYETVGAQLAMARNAVTEAAISFGDVLMPAIAGGAEAARDFATWLADLPAPMQRLAVYAGAAASGTSLLAGGFLLMLPRILETKDAFGTLISSMPRLQGALDGVRLKGMYAMESSLGRITKGAGAAGLALGTLAAAGSVMQPIWQGLAGGSHEAAEGIEAFLEHGADAEGVTGAMRRGFADLDEQVSRVFNRGTMDGVGEFFEEIGTGLGLFGGTRHDDAVAFFGELDSGLTQMVADGKGAEAARMLADVTAAAERQGVTAGQLADQLPAATAALEGYSKATSEVYQAQLDLANATDAAAFPDIVPQATDNTRAAEEYTAATDAMAERIEAGVAAHNELTAAMLGMVDAAFAAQGGAIAYEASLDALTAAITENGETHDISTEKGRANQTALLAVASAARDSAQANLENGDALGVVQADMESARAAFVRGAEQLGYTKTEANDLADQLGLTDSGVRTLKDSIGSMKGKRVAIDVDDYASAKVDTIKGKISSVTGKTVFVNIISNYTTRGSLPAHSRQHVGLASGGPIVGPGGPTADLVPALNVDSGAAYALSNNEHVMTAAEVMAAGGHSEVYRLRKALLAGAVRYDVGGQTGAGYGDRMAAMRDRWTQPMPAPQVVRVEGGSSVESGPTINISNTYPQAEPTSTTVRRATTLLAGKGRW